MPSELSQGKYRKCKDADEVSEVLKGLLNNYATEVRSKIATTSEEVAVQTARRLKEASPKRKGKYAKGWQVKEMRTNQIGLSTWVVHNKTRYRLTHLLEYGHKVRGGTRIIGKRPHIKKVEEWAQKEFPKELEKNLRKD